MLLSEAHFDQSIDVYCDSLVESLNAYQVTSLQWMQRMERGFYVTWTDTHEREMQLTSSKLGYLANRVGSGKSRVAIALCISNHLKDGLDSGPGQNAADRFVSAVTACRKLAEAFNEGHFQRSNFDTFRLKGRAVEKSSAPNKSLLIVPHSLVHQWRNEMDALGVPYVDLSIWPPARRKNITDADTHLINAANILLCSSTKLAHFANILSKLRFARIIHDEVLTASVKAVSCLKRDFTWLLSATPIELKNKDSKRQYEPWNSCYSNMELVTVRCTDAFIDSTVTLPEVEKIRHDCDDTWIIATLLSATGFQRRALIDALKADDISEAVRLIGGGARTPLELVKSLINDLEEKFSAVSTRILTLESDLSLPISAEAEVRTRRQVASLLERRDSLRVQQESLTEKIRAVPDEHCPICFDPFESPIFMQCCTNLICLECMTNIIKNAHGASSCPMCRQHTDFDRMTLVVKDGKQPKDCRVKTKKATIMNLLEEGKGKSFLIFSNYDGAFKLQTDFKDMGVTAHRLVGTGPTIQKLIADHRSGKFQVLMINSKNFGSGLNLQYVDEIIIYHDVGKFVETQVIGRVCRMGRDSSKPPIRVHQLLYKSERGDTGPAMTRF